MRTKVFRTRHALCPGIGEWLSPKGISGASSPKQGKADSCQLEKVGGVEAILSRKVAPVRKPKLLSEDKPDARRQLRQKAC